MLVGRMDGVRVESEPHQHGIESQRFLKIRHDRDRASLPDKYRLAAELITQRPKGGLHGRDGAIYENRHAAEIEELFGTRRAEAMSLPRRDDDRSDAAGIRGPTCPH